MSRLISISLSPNVFSEDITLARALLKRKDQWASGKSEQELKKAFAKKFSLSNPEDVFLFNSGRSALVSILRAFGIGRGDEVLLQAFTCNAVPNPVLWAGATPVYVDADPGTYTIDLLDLEKKITPQTKAVIVQHTFGLPGPIKEILALAKKYDLFVIEDCAHALGATYWDKYVGLFGDAAFFSFGRDKVISSVYGGAALVHTQSAKKEMGRLYQSLLYPDEQWIAQQLRHPLLLEKWLRWYNIPFANYGIGKFALQFFQGSKKISKAVHWKEKQGQKPDYFPAKLPNALATLALAQFERLDEFNLHRIALAEFYAQELKTTSYRLPTITKGHIFLRYPVRHPQAHDIIMKARKQGILLGDWYTSPIAPDDTDLEKMRYIQGSCPKAEQLAQETFNLPTNPNLSLQEAQHVIEYIKKFL